MQTVHFIETQSRALSPVAEILLAAKREIQAEISNEENAELYAACADGANKLTPEDLITLREDFLTFVRLIGYDPAHAYMDATDDRFIAFIIFPRRITH